MNAAPEARRARECEVCGESDHDVRGHDWMDLEIPRVVAHSTCAYNPLTDDRTPEDWYEQEVANDDAGPTPVVADGGVDVPSDAVPVDFEALRDEDSESWERAAPADAEVTLGDRPGLFVVQLPDSDDAHNLSLVEIRGGPWVGWCSCEGYQHHHHCAHLATVRKMAVTNDNLVPTLEEDPRHDVDADVVEHVNDQEDNQDAASPDVVETPAQDGAEAGTVNVEPRGTDAENTVPATPSDPFAEQLVEDVPDRFVMQLGGDTYIRRAGFARIARHHDLRLSLDEVVGAHETDWQHAKYRARVTDANGEVLVDSEVWSAHADLEDMAGAEGELDELAATRAARRAIEWATGAESTLETDGRRDDRARADGGVEQ